MYYFFIGPVLLPVTPSALTVDIAGSNQVVTLINDGPINILHDPQLKEAAFEVLLPTRKGTKYPFAIYSLMGLEALAFTEYFKLLQRRKIPFPFIVAKMQPGSLIPSGYEYMQAVIESYSQKEDASNGPDVTVSLKLKEYREYATIHVDATATTDKDGKLVYKATKQRGKSFTSEINKLLKEVGLDIGGMFGL
jgi:hypothetical protein